MLYQEKHKYIGDNAYMLMLKSLKKYIRLTSLIFIAILMLSSALRAEEKITTKTLDVIGTGIVKSQNVTKARDKAISNSLESAVGQAAADLIPHACLVEKFHDISETVYENAEQYIQNYKVMAELILENKYRVMVRATVSIDKLKQQLERIGIGASDKLFPKILFLVTEKMCADADLNYWWGNNVNAFKSQSESVMSDIMEENRFPIVDHITLSENDNIPYQGYLSHQEALTLGFMFKADVVISGTAIADKTLNLLGADAKTFQGTVSLQAIRTDSGKQIAEITKTATAVNSDTGKGCSDALVEACQYAGKALAHSIKGVWGKETTDQDPIEVFVEGTDNLANFVMFRRELRNVTGTEDVQIRKMQSDNASLFVKFNGDAKTLAEALILKTFAKFGIKISDISNNYLKVRLIPEKSF